MILLARHNARDYSALGAVWVALLLLATFVALLLYLACASAFAQLFPLRGAPQSDLTFAFSPPSPVSVSDATPVGSAVTTFTVANPDGTPYAGQIGFVAPNFDAGGLFALRGNTLVVNGKLPTNVNALRVTLGAR